MLKSQRNSLLRNEGIRSFILREKTPSALKNCEHLVGSGLVPDLGYEAGINPATTLHTL